MTPKSLPSNKRRNADKNLANYEAYKNRGISSGGNYNIDHLNQQAFDKYNKDALVEREYYGRTFLPDNLFEHQKICDKHSEMFKTRNKLYWDSLNKWVLNIIY